MPLMYTLLEDRREQDCSEYIADCMGAIVQRFFRYTGAEHFEFPLFTERYRPQQKRETAEEIKTRLIDRLREGSNDGCDEPCGNPVA